MLSGKSGVNVEKNDLGKKQITDCPFHKDNNTNNVNENENLDFHNNTYDFLLKPIGDEPSARKINKKKVYTFAQSINTGK